eukprot:SAG31_NODE_6524_length_1988_cov_1.866596_1_plen_662_part_11
MELMSNPSRIHQLPPPFWECSACLTRNAQAELRCTVCNDWRSDEAEKIAAAQREVAERRRRQRQEQQRYEAEKRAREEAKRRAKEANERAAAAVEIQRWYRGHLGRRRRQAVKTAIELEEKARELEVEAIQAEQVETWTRATVQVQRVWRGFVGRRRHSSLRREAAAAFPSKGEDDAARLMTMIGYFEKRMASHVPVTRKSSDRASVAGRPTSAPARQLGSPAAPGLMPGQWRPSQMASTMAALDPLGTIIPESDDDVGGNAPIENLGSDRGQNCLTKAESSPGEAVRDDLAELETAIAATEKKMVYVSLQHEALGGPLTSLSANFGRPRGFLRPSSAPAKRPASAGIATNSITVKGSSTSEACAPGFDRPSSAGRRARPGSATRLDRLANQAATLSRKSQVARKPPNLRPIEGRLQLSSGSDLRPPVFQHKRRLPSQTSCAEPPRTCRENHIDSLQLKEAHVVLPAAVAGDWKLVDSQLRHEADDGQLGPALLDAVACSWRDKHEAAAVVEYVRRLLSTTNDASHEVAARCSDSFGGTSLHILSSRAAEENGTPLAEMVRLIGEAGADCDARDERGFCPLHCVAFAAAGAMGPATRSHRTDGEQGARSRWTTPEDLAHALLDSGAGLLTRGGRDSLTALEIAEKTLPTAGLARMLRRTEAV